MLRVLLISLVSIFITNITWAQEKSYNKARVSFDDFKWLVETVEKHREERLIDFNTFLMMSKEPNTIILDTRSDFRFNRIHLKGARHLSFPDFTAKNLEKVIPDTETRILIYCNNNFDGNEVDFANKTSSGLGNNVTKSLRQRTASDQKYMEQISVQLKPLMMALNIPTYINLYGYGYKNVYELDELLDVRDPRIEFEGTIVKKSSIFDSFNFKKE